jgi:hypothetical protein
LVLHSYMAEVFSYSVNIQIKPRRGVILNECLNMFLELSISLSKWSHFLHA